MYVFVADSQNTRLKYSKGASQIDRNVNTGIWQGKKGKRLTSIHDPIKCNTWSLCVHTFRCSGEQTDYPGFPLRPSHHNCQRHCTWAIAFNYNTLQVKLQE